MLSLAPLLVAPLVTGDAVSVPADPNPAPLIPLAALTQDDEEGPELRVQTPGSAIGTTIVTANRRSMPAFDAPYSAHVVDAEEIERRSYRTTPQALRNIPGVMVQETALGQGSPFIRGFTAFRNVFLIDGIRLNNSVFRDGPNQYWNTVDPWSIQRLEVIKGPTSVLYGSDAIGGTVNAITKLPYTYGEGFQAGGSLSYRGATAEKSHIGRGELSTTWNDDTGVLVGLTGKDFGNVRGGDEVGTQFNTGYDETNADVKVEHFLSPTRRIVAAYQYTDQRNVPRTHRTQDGIEWENLTRGTDQRRDLDQRRQLAYVQLHEEGSGEGDGFSVSASYHRQEERQDRILQDNSFRSEGFDVGTIGFFAQMRSNTGLGLLSYGLEYYHDDVDSFSSRNEIQGPVADDATYDLGGLFVQDEFDTSERLSFTLGARWNWAAAQSDRVRDPATGLPTSLDESWNALVGSGRFVFRMTESANLYGGISQGFRAPNLSDLTRFSSARTNEFEVPTTDLDPEYFTSFEIGVKHAGERTTAQLATYYTDIQDMIVRFPTGQPNPDDPTETIVRKDNVGDGYVFGIELDGAYEFVPEWSAFAGATWMDGRVDTFPTSAPVVEREYIDRVMPLTIQAGVGWENVERTRWAELMARYADTADRLSTRDENDDSRIPPGGTPSYLVFHLRGGMRLNEHLNVTGACENIFDEDYRVHGSGVNMPGRNFVLGLTASF